MFSKLLSSPFHRKQLELIKSSNNSGGGGGGGSPSSCYLSSSSASSVSSGHGLTCPTLSDSSQSSLTLSAGGISSSSSVSSCQTMGFLEELKKLAETRTNCSPDGTLTFNHLKDTIQRSRLGGSDLSTTNSSHLQSSSSSSGVSSSSSSANSTVKVIPKQLHPDDEKRKKHGMIRIASSFKLLLFQPECYFLSGYISFSSVSSFAAEVGEEVREDHVTKT